MGLKTNLKMIMKNIRMNTDWYRPFRLAIVCLLMTCFPAKPAPQVPDLFVPDSTGLPQPIFNQLWLKPAAPVKKSVKEICREINAATGRLSEIKFYGDRPSHIRTYRYKDNADAKIIVAGFFNLLAYYWDEQLKKEYLIRKRLPRRGEVYLGNPKYIHGYTYRFVYEFLAKGGEHIVDDRTPKPGKEDVERQVIPTIEYYLASKFALAWCETEGGGVTAIHCILLLRSLRHHQDTIPYIIGHLEHPSHYYAQKAVYSLLDHSVMVKKPVRPEVVDFLLANIDPKRNQEEWQAGQFKAGNPRRTVGFEAYPYRKHHLGRRKIVDIRNWSLHILGKTGRTGIKALPVLRGYLKHPGLKNNTISSFAYRTALVYDRICLDSGGLIKVSDPGWMEAAKVRIDTEQRYRELERIHAPTKWRNYWRAIPYTNIVGNVTNVWQHGRIISTHGEPLRIPPPRR